MNKELKIIELEKDNLELRKEILSLNNKIEAQAISENFQSMGIIEFYTLKYLDLNTTILLSRKDKIKKKIASSTTELQNIDLIEKNPPVNKSFVIELSSIENQKIDLNQMRVKLKNQQNLQVSHLKQQIISLKDNNFNNIVNFKNFLLENYKEINLLKQQLKAIDVKSKEILEKETNLKNKDLAQEKSNSFKNEELTNVLKESIEIEINKFNLELEELESLFLSVKNRDLKEIKETINHLEIMQCSPKEIAIELDKILIKKHEELQVIDTLSNKKIKNNMKLYELLGQRDIFDSYKEEIKKLEEELDFYENNLIKAVEAIESLEEFNEQSKFLIDKHYRSLYENFITIVSNIEICVKDKMVLSEKLERLIAIKKQKILDPYAKEQISKLSQEILETKTALEKVISDLKLSRQQYLELSSTDENAKILQIFKNYQILKDNLSTIYNQKQQLILKINALDNQIIDLKNKLIDSDKIDCMIKDLENGN